MICYDSKGRVSNNGRGFIYLSGTCSVCLSVVPVCEWFRVRRLPVLRFQKLTIFCEYTPHLLDGVNFLHYPKESVMAGSYLFKKYVDDLYGLKLEKVKGAKLLLNTLWGGLSEKKIYMSSTELTDKADFSGCEIT